MMFIAVRGTVDGSSGKRERLMRTAFLIVGLFVSTGLGSALGSQSAPAPAGSAITPSAGEKLICRKQVETGSLVKGKKTCMTGAEWAKVGDAARDGGQYLLEQNEGKPSCNGQSGC